MEIEDIDFEGKAVDNNANNDGVNNDNTKKGNEANEPDTTDLDTGKTGDIDDNGNEGNNDNNDGNDKHDDNNNKHHDLEAGSIIEFDGVEYTVAENGDIVDKDGKVFKEAKDVKSWIAENNVADEGNEDEINIDTLQEQLGTEIVDDKGNKVKFSNNAEGVKAYVEAVINLRSEELRNGTMNKFFNDNPMVKQFIDYVTINGSPIGFGELQDRTKLTIDKDNKEQQISIIRMAAKEFGNKSLNENYIKYLESTGSLYDEAKNQLEALKAKDVETRKAIETRAAQQREEDRKAVENYFKKVNDVITNRKIGEYTLPESIVKERNGQKVTLTLNDFFDYVGKATEEDENGDTMTAYQRDLNNLTDDEVINKDLIDAWLMFTGGSYKDLIDMIAKEDNVRKLVIKSKENRNRRQINVKKPTKSKFNPDDIVF